MWRAHTLRQTTTRPSTTTPPPPLPPLPLSQSTYTISPAPPPDQTLHKFVASLMGQCTAFENCFSTTESRVDWFVATHADTDSKLAFLLIFHLWNTNSSLLNLTSSSLPKHRFQHQLTAIPQFRAKGGCCAYVQLRADDSKPLPPPTCWFCIW